MCGECPGEELPKSKTIIFVENAWTILSAIVCIVATWKYFKRENKTNISETDHHEKEDAVLAPDVVKKYMTKTELEHYIGLDNRPIYIALKGKIFDVSTRSDFYGPEGGYHLFAGKDATIALAKMSFEPENLVLDDYDHLSFMESETMNDWMFKFESVKKYPIIGRVLKQEDMTREQVETLGNGLNDHPQYIVLDQKIHDVTLFGAESMFGPGKPYASLVGKDITTALKEDSTLNNLWENMPHPSPIVGSVV